MTGLSLQEAQAQLEAWCAASRAVSQSQSYTIATESSSRTLTRADARVIAEQIVFWQRQVQRLLRGGIGVGHITIDHPA